MGGPIDFESMYNVRDLGGTPVAGGVVKEGLLLRGDQPFFATESDIRALAERGIGLVVDFRSMAEQGEKPDPAIPGARGLSLPIIDDMRAGITRDRKSDGNVVEMLARGAVDGMFSVDSYMQDMYRKFVLEPFAAAQYARFVDELVANAERGKATFWHCTAGKDRAGFAAAIVLEALGADRDAIRADYILTNERLAGVVDRIIDMIAAKLPTEEVRAEARRFFGADWSYLDAAYAAATERFGSFAGFLEEAIGIDAAKRERMRELFVE